MASLGDPEILPHGVDGLVVRLSERLTDEANLGAIGLQAALSDDPPLGMEEAASALASVFLRYDPGATTFEALADAVRQRLGGGLERKTGSNARLWTVPAVFGGTRAPGLEAAAKAAGLNLDEAIADLTAKPVRVLAIGFAPGQPYLGELPERWDIPRLPDLIQVPEGALVLAIRQLVLFANPSPTGWGHVAQTAFRVFRPEEDDPFAFRPGDQVRFRAVSEDELDALAGTENGGATCESGP